MLSLRLAKNFIMWLRGGRNKEAKTRKCWKIVFEAMLLICGVLSTMLNTAGKHNLKKYHLL